MVQDILILAKMLEEKLRNYNTLMKHLNPILTLIGSAVEATRVGYGNELDLTVEFEGFITPPFQVTDKDPFHLTASQKVPLWMAKYIDKDNKFIYALFMGDFLEAVNSCIGEIFQEKRNPKKLSRTTTNEDYESYRLKCKECKSILKEKTSCLFQQCKTCVVTVSQTKMGVCLQGRDSPSFNNYS
jgi:hypothetical protein